MSSFEKALEHVLEVEGGYVDHPKDPGGATNMGITRKTLSEWRGATVSKEDVRGLTREEAAKIYRARYWDAVRGDELPPAVAFLMMDVAVNSGPTRAVKTVQKALSALGQGLRIDGKIGPKTLAAINAAPIDRLIDEFVVRRGIFYATRELFGVFGLGWARRLVSTARRAHSLNDAVA